MLSSKQETRNLAISLIPTIVVLWISLPAQDKVTQSNAYRIHVVWIYIRFWNVIRITPFTIINVALAAYWFLMVIPDKVGPICGVLIPDGDFR